jgi:hypothetical protein
VGGTEREPADTHPTESTDNGGAVWVWFRVREKRKVESPLRAIVDVVVGMCFVVVCLYLWRFAMDVANGSERMEIFLLVRRDARVCDISVRCVEV